MNIKKEILEFSKKDETERNEKIEYSETCKLLRQKLYRRLLPGGFLSCSMTAFSLLGLRRRWIHIFAKV